MSRIEMRLVLLKTERSERISSSTSIHRMRFPHSPLGKVNIRRHSQAVRPRSAKPLFPGSNPGGTSKKLRTSIEVLNFFIQADRLGISSRVSVYIIKGGNAALVSHHTVGVYLCRLDDIQLLAKLMICNSCGIDDIQGSALIFLQKCGII